MRDIKIDRYKRKCPFCDEIGEAHCLINLICKCGAKYYYESDIWIDRKTGKEAKGDLWNLTSDTIIKALDCFHKRILNTELASKVYESEISAVIDAIALIKELTEENERLKELGTKKEIEKELVRRETKADTIRKMRERFKMYFGTYVLGYKISLSEALKAVNQIEKEMLEGLKNE